MKKQILALSVAVALMLGMNSCTKDDNALDQAVTVNVIGYVTNSYTNQPVVDAEVVFNTLDGEEKVKTDKMGKYTIKGQFAFSDSGYLVKIKKAGYLKTAKMVAANTSTIYQLGALPLTQNFEGDCKLDTLMETLKTMVYITSENTIPAKSVSLTLIYASNMAGDYKPQPDTIVTTDANGLLTVTNMPYAAMLKLKVKYNDGKSIYDDYIKSSGADLYASAKSITGNTGSLSKVEFAVTKFSKLFNIVSSNIISDLYYVENFSQTGNIEIVFSLPIDTINNKLNEFTISCNNGFTVNNLTIKGSAITLKKSIEGNFTKVILSPSRPLGIGAYSNSTFKDSTWVISIPNMKSTDKVSSFSAQTIKFKTK